MMLNTIDRSASIRLSRPSARTLAGALAISGAALVAIGVVLPWFSLFAGLQPISALGTPNGSALLVGAFVTAGLGILAILRGDAWVRRILALVGIVLSAFSAYLVVGLVTVYRNVSADPLVVAQLGPGLGFIVVGSLFVLGTAFLRD
jgi:hypothetical protein